MPTEMPTDLSSSDSEVTEDCSEIPDNPRIEPIVSMRIFAPAPDKLHAPSNPVCSAHSLLIPTQFSGPRRTHAASKLVLVAGHLLTTIIFET